MVPSEAQFEAAPAVEAALASAGFVEVSVRALEPEFEFTTGEYLEGRALSSGGRYARRLLGEAAFQDVLRAAQAEFRDRFGDEVRYSRRVLLARGVRP